MILTPRYQRREEREEYMIRKRPATDPFAGRLSAFTRLGCADVSRAHRRPDRAKEKGLGVLAGVASVVVSNQ